MSLLTQNIQWFCDSVQQISKSALACECTAAPYVAMGADTMDLGIPASLITSV